MKTFRNLWADDSGVSSVEYALLLAFVAAGISVLTEQLSEAVQGALCDAAEQIEAAEVCDPP